MREESSRTPTPPQKGSFVGELELYNPHASLLNTWLPGKGPAVARHRQDPQLRHLSDLAQAQPERDQCEHTSQQPTAVTCSPS